MCLEKSIMKSKTNSIPVPGVSIQAQIKVLNIAEVIIKIFVLGSFWFYWNMTLGLQVKLYIFDRSHKFFH